MKKVNDFFKEWGNTILVFFVLVISLKTCGVSSTSSDNSEELNSLTNKVDSLQNELDETKNKVISQEELDVMQDEMMYDFLLYEKELDDGEITLTQIKEKTKVD